MKEHGLQPIPLKEWDLALGRWAQVLPVKTCLFLYLYERCSDSVQILSVFFFLILFLICSNVIIIA